MAHVTGQVGLPQPLLVGEGHWRGEGAAAAAAAAASRKIRAIVERMIDDD
jgi:hypothetical protein